MRLSAKIPLAIARGLNEGGDKVRTQVQHALQRQTGLVMYRSVTSRVHTIRAYPGNLDYQIIAKGKPAIPIKEFRVTRGPRGVVAFPWAKEHDFKRSFVGKGRVSGAFWRASEKSAFPCAGCSDRPWRRSSIRTNRPRLSIAARARLFRRRSKSISINSWAEDLARHGRAGSGNGMENYPKAHGHAVKLNRRRERNCSGAPSTPRLMRMCSPCKPSSCTLSRNSAIGKALETNAPD